MKKLFLVSALLFAFGTGSSMADTHASSDGASNTWGCYVRWLACVLTAIDSSDGWLCDVEHRICEQGK